jgi:hypothetical protein
MPLPRIWPWLPSDSGPCPDLLSDCDVLVTFVSFKELIVKSMAKSVFLHRERDIWDSLHHHKGLHCPGE